MSYQAYPLEWPRELGIERTPSGDRRDASFFMVQGGERNRVSLTEAVSRLLTEIGRINGVDPGRITISTDIPAKKDGTPYANARKPKDPGAAVYFYIDEAPFCYPCDAWTRVEDNIAAIAAHVGAMRGQERWKVATVRAASQRFALPSPATVGGESWQHTLGVENTASDDAVRDAYRRMRSKHHTDNGGDPAVFHRIQMAWQQARRERGL